MDSLLQLSDCPSAELTHVVEIEVKDGELKIATRLQNTSCLAEDVAVVRLWSSDRETVDHSSEALGSKGELVQCGGVLDLVVIGGTKRET